MVEEVVIAATIARQTIQLQRIALTKTVTRPAKPSMGSRSSSPRRWRRSWRRRRRCAQALKLVSAIGQEAAIDDAADEVAEEYPAPVGHYCSGVGVVLDPRQRQQTEGAGDEVEAEEHDDDVEARRGK